MIKNGNRPELVAPGGSFQAAAWAFKNGADAVYIGLKQYSARKGAKNFSYESLCRLLALAEYYNGRVYVAMNTVIRESEIDDFLKIITDLVNLKVDGIIFQDLGLLLFVQKYFPSINLHASTQCGVHSAEGVKYLASLGIKRIILSRELGFKEICNIRKACKGIELEVFIHGALCYSMSGFCLASGMHLGRSGNRGECAQICRTWFKGPDGGRYYFSCNDLMLGEKINLLANIGIDALKIEGRMKSPAYVAEATAAYSSILNGDNKKADRHFERLKVIFLRNPTLGFFKNPEGEDIINPFHASRMGIPLGKVLSVKKNSFLISLYSNIYKRDGLLFLKQGNPPKAELFKAGGLVKGNKKVASALAGEEVWVYHETIPSVGQIVRKITTHDSSLPQISEYEYEPRKIKVSTEILFGKDGITVKLYSGKISISEKNIPLCFQQKKGEHDFKSIFLKEIQKSADSLFRITSCKIKNKEVCMEKLFLPPSVLKKTRRYIYAWVKDSYEEYWKSTIKFYKEEILESLILKVEPEIILPLSLLKRSTIICEHVPFILDPDKKLELIPLKNACICFWPLPPLINNEKSYFNALLDVIKKNPSVIFIIGLNSIAHLNWVKQLKCSPFVCFFIDFYLYCANRATISFFVKNIPSLAFIYSWIEEKQDSSSPLGKIAASSKIPIIPVDSDFRPPYLLSRICFLRHSLNYSCKECNRHGEAILEQQGKKYRLYVHDCISYLIPLFKCSAKI